MFTTRTNVYFILKLNVYPFILCDFLWLMARNETLLFERLKTEKKRNAQLFALRLISRQRHGTLSKYPPRLLINVSENAYEYTFRNRYFSQQY